MRELEFDKNLSAEVPKPTDKHQSLSSSPRGVDSQDADPLHIIELLPVNQPSAGQVTHEQHDDTSAEASVEHLVRADTEQCLGDEISSGSPNPGGFHLRTSHLPTIRRLDGRSTSKASPMWRAYHQDFYASKWFRSIQIFIIVSVILVALVLYLFVSPVVNIDIFDMIPVLIFLFFSPIICVFCIVIGGIFRSKVFR